MTEHSSSRVLIMTAGGINPQVMINAIHREFSDLHVIQEEAEPKSVLLKRRAKRFGWMHALGQLATMIASRLGKGIAARRSEEIIHEHGLIAAPNPAVPVTSVSSLNDASCHAAVSAIRPAVVFTISCRILSSRTLAAIPCPVINFHAGINPMYRGQMGGYWALVEGDAQNFGATVHLVDNGVDTGGTLYEKRISPARSDTMATYPLLMTASATDIAIKAIQDAITGNLKPYEPAGPSALRFPPPIWTWLYHGITKKIW
ncbi:formyl transferase [Rhizobium sp. CFBP 13726]|uniref:formyl transferase n=1 Tax=Rhizobium sp. CFBP 13726 TaxID=2775296 RepID=UPI0010D731B8|nr:formyl transferase [Rhizobium sp. CFBP 13726]MBD8650334.1 formyl transferase [Rhizobium sp. CFBP 13726]RYE69665.1 MAG: formyl transferase [Rhizobiaceae bacterium]